MNKKIIVLGGGTITHVRNHLALAAPAFGTTARKIAQECTERFKDMDVELVLTKMADPMRTPSLITNEDVHKYIDGVVRDNRTKIMFFSAAMCDFQGIVGNDIGKYAQRLSSQVKEVMRLLPTQKVINSIRKSRKDIFLVGFKTTCGATKKEQFTKGLNLLKTASCNLVVANDTKTRETFIITPEEAVYGENMTRDELLKELVDMVYWRTHLSFTRSTVVDGKPAKWQWVKILFPSLTKVVEHCIEQGAYKPFNGATVGHFAAKIGRIDESGKHAFLTSIRKTNFNDINENGMVIVETDGPDNVISYGAKPSVGGQSQRIVFGAIPDVDCIVHFHCPLKKNAYDLNHIPVISQREYECGSHECGENTARGLGVFYSHKGVDLSYPIYCVMLDKHGPNIVFNKNINPQEVIDFIDRNFDLQGTTAGFQEVILPPSVLGRGEQIKISETINDAMRLL